MTINLKHVALEVINIETQVTRSLKESINEQFTHACELILNCPGHVIVTGIGKSGHIGAKIAATLSSTGTPSFFLHPAEAAHGDLGMVTVFNVVLAISKSGMTKEILDMLPGLKQQGIALIALTCNAESTLAQQADSVLLTPITREACSLNLAPTSSTTAALVMGDALAIAVSRAKRFTSQDFAACHPGGTLGERLSLSVADVCHCLAEIPLVAAHTSLADTLIAITEKKMGSACIIDAENRLQGILTDGDIRRALIKNHDIYTTPVSTVMTRQCISVPQEMLVVDALSLMNKQSVTSLVVTAGDGVMFGLLTIHDVLRTDIFFEEEYPFVEQGTVIGQEEVRVV